ncbi:MAG: hypothetical protein M3471_01850 [Actinomycetota bacterium]|nr:hypothetical protein [Actinomycetota bacterium]
MGLHLAADFDLTHPPAAPTGWSPTATPASRTSCSSCRAGGVAARDRVSARWSTRRMGVADRHLDFALVLRSFVANFGADEAWRIFDAIGGPAPDADRIEWYRIVDDLW